MKTFIEFHMMGGYFFMNFLSLFALAVVIMFCTGAYFLFFSKNKKLILSKNLILGIIYLGGFSAVWGILGQGIGIYMALTAIQAAGDVSPAMIVGGMKVAMIAPFYGVFILLGSSILWYILKVKYNIVEQQQI